MINTPVYKNSCDQINRKGNDLTELCVCKKTTTTTTILINANICEQEELCGFFLLFCALAEDTKGTLKTHM